MRNNPPAGALSFPRESETTADQPMSSADLYQQRAVECFSLADDFSDPQQREAMRRLALLWLHLFDQANENREQEAAPQGRSAV